MEKNQIRVVKYLTNEPTKYKRVASVFETSDYSEFTTYKSNREPDHIGRIEANIIDKGYISNPILCTIDPVTGKLIIIDGVNRMNACKELGLPVSFTLLEDATENDMVALNLVSKNWNKLNYIRFYASKGLDAYVTFLSFLNEYPDFTTNTMEHVLKLSSEEDRNVTRSSKHHKLERGMFVIKDAARSREILDFCMKVKNVSTQDIVYNQDRFVQAIMRLYRLDVFDPEEMLAKIETYKRKIVRCVATVDYAAMLEEVYNYKHRGGKVHFDI